MCFFFCLLSSRSNDDGKYENAGSNDRGSKNLMAKDEKALKGDKERRWKMEDGYFQISKVM